MTSGINLDPHDEATFPAGESLVGKAYYMVTLTTEGKVVLAKAGEVAFVLINEPASGESATIAVPLQVKAVAGEEIKPGWKLKVNAEGKLVKATEEKHVCAICTSANTVKTNALFSVYSCPAGCTG